MRQAAWRTTAGAAQRGRDIYPEVQLIDLSGDGRIKAHRDSVKLFGEFSAGINLLATAVIRFRPMSDPEATPGGGAAADPATEEEMLNGAGVIDVILRPRTMYVMHGSLRWAHTHEILGADETAAVLERGGYYEGFEPGPRGRRVSVIARDLGARAFNSKPAKIQR